MAGQRHPKTPRNAPKWMGMDMLKWLERDTPKCREMPQNGQAETPQNMKEMSQNDEAKPSKIGQMETR